jgi:site-specific recombinase XerD
MQWIERFLSYALQPDKRIADLTSNDFKEFLSHLALKQRVSASTQNQAFNAILFLFRNVLNLNPEGINNAVRAKRGVRVSVVFMVDEVKQLFSHRNGLNRLIAELLYGSGMRLTEVARLRVKDIDMAADTIY